VPFALQLNSTDLKRDRSAAEIGSVRVWVAMCAAGVDPAEGGGATNT